MFDRLRAVHAFDDHIRFVERTIDVPFAHAPMVVGPEVGIDGSPLVDLRPVGVERLADVEERRPLFVFDLDQLDGLAGGVLVPRRDHGDRLPLVADVVLGEQRLVRRDTERFEVAVNVFWHVLVGDDGMDARQRLRLARVETRDGRVVVGRTQRLRPENAADADIVDVRRAPGDVGDAVVTWKSRSYGLHAGLPGMRTSVSSGSKLASTRSG